MPEESARLEGYPTLSIHADHISMCKFKDAQDGNYQKVVEVLERWAKELKEEIKKTNEEGRIKPVTSSWFLQKAVTESILSLGIWSQTLHLGTITKGINSGCSSRKAQSTLVVVGPG